MEGCMVKHNEYISFIKRFFEDNVSDFKLVTESFHGPFWHIEYSKNEIKVTISGDIGFQVVVDFYGTKYSLWQYDYSVSLKGKTSIENIDYQLNILRNLLYDLNTSNKKLH